MIHVPNKATFMGSKSCLGQFLVRGYQNPPEKVRPHYLSHGCEKWLNLNIYLEPIFMLMGAQSGMKVSCEFNIWSITDFILIMPGQGHRPERDPTLLAKLKRGNGLQAIHTNLCRGSSIKALLLTRSGRQLT